MIDTSNPERYARRRRFSDPQSPCSVNDVTQSLRILFVVDDSGSTATTDPNDTNRVATIQNFLNTYGSKANLTYSYSYFGSVAETYDPTKSTFTSSANSNFETAAQAQTALDQFENLGTAGTTRTTSAFSQLQDIIEGDNTANENYVVIFMSDGQPTDLGNSASDQLSGVSSLATGLMGLAASGKITLSTVYFGPNDSQAEANLQTMATIGGGQFINTNVTTTYSIDGLITVPGQACSP